MNRQELEKLILSEYGVSAEYPWASAPTFAVFRHSENKKWFAVIMTVARRKLGIDEDGQIDVVNVKCDANLVPGMWLQGGVYPAYHMNKEHWLTVSLEDGGVEDGLLTFLLSLSFECTLHTRKKVKTP